MTPQVVKDEEGKLYLQLRHGSNTATIPLPPGFESWPEERVDSFCKTFVKETMPELIVMRRTDARKLNRKLNA